MIEVMETTNNAHTFSHPSNMTKLILLNRVHSWVKWSRSRLQWACSHIPRTRESWFSSAEYIPKWGDGDHSYSKHVFAFLGRAESDVDQEAAFMNEVVEITLAACIELHRSDMAKLTSPSRVHSRVRWWRSQKRRVSNDIVRTWRSWLFPEECIHGWSDGDHRHS